MRGETYTEQEYAPKFNPPLDDWVGAGGATVKLTAKVTYFDL